MQTTTIQECITILKNEKENELTSRFPCRVILSHSRQGYQTITHALSGLCDRTVSPNELFSGADLLPAYDTLVEKLNPNEWVILPGVSEYLRLFHDSELRSGRFTKLWHQMVDASSRGRIIIPLWNCDALWHDKALNLETDIRQENDIFSLEDDCSEAETLKIIVFSSDFEEYINQLSGKYSLIIGIREWYEHLMDSSQMLNNYCLLTKQIRTVVPIIGDVTIRTIKDTYTFVTENLSDGDRLKRNMCTPEILEELFKESLKNVSVNEAIKNCFNIVLFDGVTAIASWNNLSLGKKQLLKLWYQLNPDYSYLCMCMEKSDVENIEYQLLHSIFDVMQIHPEWIDEYKRVVSALNLKKDNSFFKQLDEVNIYEDRIPFLTSDTREERIYILRMVGRWIKQDAAQVCSSEALKRLYPALFEYLQKMPDSVDKSYNEYMNEYKMYKLSNTLPDSEEQILNMVDPESLPYRYAVLNQYMNSYTAIMWVDAMGFEYLPLLLWVLKQDHHGHVKSVELTQATLPTETMFNDQWKQMDIHYEKRDKLDKLSHKGVIDEPDYYVCIEEQLGFFFDKLVEAIDELLLTHERVIITGDHGTSRLAARYFHTRAGITPPPNAIVYSHGRYCRVSNGEGTSSNFVKQTKDSNGNQYWVFSSYDHFTIGGFAAGGDEDNAIYGEVHGGASPEEMVVPVVIFDNNNSIPLTAKLKDGNTRLKKGVIKIDLELNKPVDSLQINVGGMTGNCISSDKKLWTVRLSDIAPGTYAPVIIADGQLIASNEILNVRSALGGDGDI